MKIIITLSAILALSVSLVAFAGPRRPWISGCGPGGCPVPQIHSTQNKTANAKDEWRPVSNSPDEIALFRNRVHIGSWSLSDGYWRDYDAARDLWGPKSLIPPVEPPERAQAIIKVTRIMPEADELEWKDAGVPTKAEIDLTDPANHGVDWDKINAPQATLNGRKIGCDRAIELIGKQVPDDSKKFRFTVIGTAAEQKDTLAQWASLEPEIRDRCLTWAVAPDHWSLQDSSTGQAVFKTAGTPVIYFQDPAGKVLHRQDDAKDFPQAVRKAVKGYDAAKDPDLRKQEVKKPTKTDPAAPPIHPALIVFGAIGGAALLFFLKGK